MMKIKMIKDYQFEGVLGEGGMAVVYLAEHQLFHSKVAVKVLNREFVHNENIRKRFISEARNMFKMSHPNIVRVTDMIDDGETVAFVMEYIEGESLKEYLDRKGKLGDEQIQYILQQMLDALEYVHGQGLVHRDIKPSNFMLTPQGKVMLMDFGIAKQLNPGSPEYTSTGTNQQMGTAMYMSPEQVKSTKDVTHVTDIYSLGVVLWQMVTGKRPYNQSELSIPEIQVSIIKEPLPTLETKWDTVIQAATEKDEQKRYRDAKEFKEALKRVDRGNAQESTRIEDKTVFEPKGISPTTNSVPEGSVTTPKKKKNPIVIIIGIALILGIGYLIWIEDAEIQNDVIQILEEIEYKILDMGSLIWNGNAGTQNIIKEKESIGSSVKIGNQTWQAENLYVDRFRNGDLIPEVRTAEEWKAAGERGEPAWCYYENDPKNGKIYGKLYNWYAVNDSRGLAPEGWHIPTDEEWTTLTDYLGGEKVAGGKMKSTGIKYWTNKGTTNVSGFSALPGGLRYDEDGNFGYSHLALFWSGTESGNYDVWIRWLSDVNGRVYRNGNEFAKPGGLSVRCLRD
jgi:uncharacterized protein (TIGR02145 family)